MKARYTFTIDPVTIEALEHMAKGNRRSKSSMVELAITKEFDQYIKLQRDKVEAREEALRALK